jgi:FkbM family methyltransferase
LGRISPYHIWILNKYIHKGDFVVDVGANCGDYSAYFLKRGATVAAFEPASVSRELRERFSNNWGINCHEVAVGKETGYIKIHEYADSGSSSGADRKDTGNPVKSYMINCVMLDNFYFAPSFIKIDTEGMDYEVLLGAKETLKKYHPIVLAECHPATLGYLGYTKLDMLKFMGELGYDFQTIQAYNVVTDFLFIPKDKHEMVL